MKRRDFIKWSVASGLMLPLVSCNPKRKISGKIIGASSSVGHLLRHKSFGEPNEISNQDVVIVGGGVSGLSAARYLTKKGFKNITVIDLEMQMGGNSASGVNSISKYPWGAHYIPLPNNNLTEYLSFLEDCNVITGYNNAGIPDYNEYFLCQDPEERLYINGSWQDGLVPRNGLNENEMAQFNTFFEYMHDFRTQKGSDGKDAFAIPIDRSSRDETFTVLDKMTMHDWMEQKGLNNDYIKWYVNYCTRDDFGTTYDRISAWTGIHYFASRKGYGGNAAYHDVLTWEEGNGFLVSHLLKDCQVQLLNQCMTVAVDIRDNSVQVNYFDTKNNKLKGITANHCILAVPQFVASRLLKDVLRTEKVKAHIHYTPWMVANLTVPNLVERSGAPPSWDNVVFNSKGLGYVDATHQQLQQLKPKRNLTYYRPLTDSDPQNARRKAMETTHEQWVEAIVKDLRIVHPDIEDQVENIDIMVWGHAMAQPLPGMIFGNMRSELSKSIENKIHFAHTDLAGISIFEEAFYQGIKAARKITGEYEEA